MAATYGRLTGVSMSATLGPGATNFTTPAAYDPWGFLS